MQMINIEKKIKFFKALGDPIRIKIIDFLLNKKDCACICELANFLKRDQSVIFRHIELLKDAGIIKTEKEKKFLICCINNKRKIRKCLED